MTVQTKNATARNIHIAGTGLYVPPRVMTNADLEKILDDNIHEFVANKIGIHQRHVAENGDTTAVMARNAAEEALKDAGITAMDLDLIVLATDTPEFISPATSAKVQHLLGAENAGFFDLNSACSGFVMALDTASKHMIVEEHLKNVLVIGAYNMTRFIDWHDKKPATIFADGASAFVLRSVEDDGSGRLASKYLGMGRFHDYMGIYGGGVSEPITHEMLDDPHSRAKVRFIKKFSPQHNIDNWPKLVEDCLKRSGLTKSDVKQYIFTQINIGATRAVMQALDEPMEKTMTIMDRYGYTGSACVPMAYHEYVKANGINKGDIIVFCASGGGLSMCCYVYRH